MNNQETAMNEQAINAMTEGPYDWAIIPAGPNQTKHILGHFDFGTGDVHMVYLPKHPLTNVGNDPSKPEHAVIFCMVGNGPNSKANVLGLITLLNQRAIVKAKSRNRLPIPTTPEAVAWSEWAMELEHALGIAHPVPESLKNWSPA